MTVELYIDKSAGGRLTPEALLRSTGSIDIWLSAWELPKNKCCVFHIADEAFCFNLGFIDGQLVFQRNQHIMSVEESFFKQLPGNQTFIASWEPDKLIVLLGPRGFQGPSIRRVIKFEPIPTPLNLVRWAREQSLIPTQEYPKEADFVARVHTGLAMLQDKIDSMPNKDIFWNIDYEGKKISCRRPKRETDLHGVIHAFLSDQFFLASIEVIPEAKSSVGNLDFLFVGYVKGKGLKKVCTEFKLAHSDNLVKGIEFQLPAYMKAQATENGAYCIIDFEKKEREHIELRNHLSIAAAKGWKNKLFPIKIHHFYLSNSKSASTL